ncbi:MAG: glucose-6-phosphate isomerase [Acetobacteraceae bacterium]|nr:glucose-6-phosphate isomerase [Acetobacteraceae bacterium]
MPRESPPPSSSLTEAPSLAEAWARLAALAARPGAGDIRALFAADPGRAARCTAMLDDLTLDWSKTAIDAQAHAALLALAEATGLGGFRDRLFAGAAVNVSEGRAAMHMALRSPRDAGLHAVHDGGIDAASRMAAAERARMADFVARVHDGRLRGATGERFTTVLNIGIGGSDLGPRMVTEALTMVGGGVMAAHFLSNVDGHAFAGLARQLDPARTLVLVASKTFTTQETMTNAAAARAWLVAGLGEAGGEAAVAAHFVALSANEAAAAAFGIGAERVFGFRDWVGGRYSLWSAVGLSIALAAGWAQFAALLDGAWAMDQHFRTAAPAENLPVLLALVGIWHVNAMGYRAQCILPYDARLHRFAAHLQQVEMESNGKSVLLDGRAALHATCPVVFGEPGTDAQHSFMQLVHQGTTPVPVDFLLAARPDHDRDDAHRILAANAFAQAEALLAGKSRTAVEAEMRAAGADAETIAAIAPHRVFSGNRPSTTILFRRLDAHTLGRLVALYEHKVAVQGCIWGVNSFDQWGVELGKVLAGGIGRELAGEAVGAHDFSTAALIARFRALREG